MDAIYHGRTAVYLRLRYCMSHLRAPIKSFTIANSRVQFRILSVFVNVHSRQLSFRVELNLWGQRA